MADLYILVGVPGSGKSYYAEKTAAALHNDSVIVSSDQIRKELFGDEASQQDNAAVFRIFHKRIDTYLAEGKTVFADATNITLKARKPIIEIGKKHKSKIFARVFNIPVEECIKRDAERARTVGEAVINKMIRNFQFPQTFEGIDKVIVHRILPYDIVKEHTIFENMRNFNQDNPHHIYTLGEHCLRCAENYIVDTVPYLAAKWHDIGKLFTKTIDDNGIAHYYNHDNVGTYYLASHTELISDDRKEYLNNILFYINYHMRMHRDIAPGTKAAEKYTNLFGEYLYFNLWVFAEFDKIASGTYTKHVCTLRDKAV